MVRRTRTAKELGTRHNLQYFKAWSGMRRWRLALSLALPLLFAGWLLLQAATGDEMPYTSGPLSPPHNVFGKQCEACHSSSRNMLGQVSFQKNATDAACSSCHAAPAHQPNVSFTPACASCHVEHEGVTHLSRVSDKNCVQCHAALTTSSGQPRFQATIHSFNDRHPEFTAVREKKDPGSIALNHAVHLKAGLAGPDGSKVQMECRDCHRPTVEAAGPWPYAEKTSARPAATQPVQAEDLPPSFGRAFMGAITYSRQCAACHALQFDKRFNDGVPHDKPDAVRAFLTKRYQEYIAANPAAVREVPEFDRRIPGMTPPRVAGSAAEWVEFRTGDAEQLLWRKTCKQCHSLEVAWGEGSAPVAPAKVKPAAIPARWMQHARFSHYSHQGMDCAACHAEAAKSTATADVLLPGIATCQSCHSGQPDKVGVAENGCFLCHQYHDWKQHTAPKGQYTVPQLTSYRAR